MLEAACAEWANVSVTTFRGLLVDFCTVHDIDLISKGVRAADFENELQMAQMNRGLTGVDTVLLPTEPQWAYVSSTLIREMAGLGGDVSRLLLPAREHRRSGGRGGE